LAALQAELSAASGVSAEQHAKDMEELERLRNLVASLQADLAGASGVSPEQYAKDMEEMERLRALVASLQNDLAAAGSVSESEFNSLKEELERLRQLQCENCLRLQRELDEKTKENADLQEKFSKEIADLQEKFNNAGDAAGAAMAEAQEQLAGAEANKQAALAEQEARLKALHEKEMDEALVLVRMVQSRRKEIADALEQASKCQETLSFIRPWKVSYLAVLEVALLLAEIAGVEEETIEKYTGFFEGETEKRKFREKLEKMARTKGTKREQITSLIQDAKAAGLSNDECKDTETYWFQRSGKV